MRPDLTLLSVVTRCWYSLSASVPSDRTSSIKMGNPRLAEKTLWPRPLRD
jgi:hypothetical protein